MSLPINTGETSTAENVPQVPVHVAGFTDGQLVEFLRVLRETNDHQRPKVKQPPGFAGARSQLRTWLVQCNMYFGATTVTSDGDKITYTKSLLRDAAAKWITIHQRKPTRNLDEMGQIRECSEETVHGCRSGEYSKNKDRQHDSGSQDLYGLLERIQADSNGGQLGRQNNAKATPQRIQQSHPRCMGTG